MKLYELNREAKIKKDAEWRRNFALFPVPVSEADENGKIETRWLEF